YAEMAADALMLITGTIELRGARLLTRGSAKLAQAGEKTAAKYVSKKAWIEFSKGTFHVGLALSGAGKQAIKNHAGKYADPILHTRQALMLADMTVGVLSPKWGTSLLYGADIPIQDAQLATKAPTLYRALEPLAWAGRLEKGATKFFHAGAEGVEI